MDNNIENKTKEFMKDFVSRVRYRFNAMNYYAKNEGMKDVPLEHLEQSPRFKSFIAKLTSSPIVDKWIDTQENKEPYSTYLSLRERIKNPMNSEERSGAERQFLQEKYKIFESIPQEWRDATAMKMFDDEMRKATVYKWGLKNKRSNPEIYETCTRLAKEDPENFKEYVNSMYESKIPDDYKDKIKHEHINSWLHARQVNCKMRVHNENIGIAATKAGYCLKSVTEILYSMAKNKGILQNFPKENAIPDDFVREFQNNSAFSDFIYKTSSETSFDEIIKEKDIKAGAIVFDTNKEGIARHAMFWDGKRDDSGDAVLISFNNEVKDVKGSTRGDGSVREMYVIDIQKMVKRSFENKENVPEKSEQIAPSRFDYLLLKSAIRKEKN